MSTISGISSSSFATMQASMRQRPDPAQMAAELFAKLDTSGQGYIQQSDLEAALSSVSSATSASSTAASGSADALFAQLDGDSDGKVTQQEFSDGLQKLAEQLDGQFNSMRMGGMPPPPPPGASDDAGFTQDELTAMASELASTDSKRSTLMNALAANFDSADANGDGKVSASEAMAYDRQNQVSATDSSAASGAASSGNDLTAQVMRQVMQLMQAYGIGQDGASAASTLSISV